MRILVVDDEKLLVKGVKFNLEICGGDFCDVGCIPFILLYIVNGSVTAVGILINLTMPHTAHPA